ncbi:MAG: ABC transporter permease [Bacillota bacterium]
MGLQTVIVRRLALLVLVLFGITLITFVLSNVVPVDPIVAKLGEKARPELVEKMRKEWGFDKPLPVQYVRYVAGLLRGDLGVSIRTRRPVAQDLRDYFPATMELATVAIIISVCLGIPVGVIAAVRKDRLIDHLTRVFALGGASMPIFWMALLLLLLLYYRLGWLPGTGRLDILLAEPPRVTGLLFVDSLLARDWAALASAARHILLPAFCLGYFSTAVIARMTRSSMLEVVRQDYIRTARSKGLAERVVIYKHALKNALIPTTTVIGLAYGSLLSGAVLTETIFGWPGMGRYATNSVLNVDIPAVLGVTLLSALVYALANLAVDVVYVFLDPRIRYQ